MKRAAELFRQYQDVILYLFFGVCTTAVNAVSYYVCSHPLSLGVMPSTLIAWVLAVFFAYVTNRTWVFHSDAHGREAMTREILSFFSCRVGTGFVDWGCMFLFVDVLGCNDMVIKILDNVLVVILNYVASKLVIFRKRRGEP